MPQRPRKGQISRGSPQKPLKMGHPQKRGYLIPYPRPEDALFRLLTPGKPILRADPVANRALAGGPVGWDYLTHQVPVAEAAGRRAPHCMKACWQVRNGDKATWYLCGLCAVCGESCLRGPGRDGQLGGAVEHDRWWEIERPHHFSLERRRSPVESSSLRRLGARRRLAPTSSWFTRA